MMKLMISHQAEELHAAGVLSVREQQRAGAIPGVRKVDETMATLGNEPTMPKDSLENNN